MCHEHYLKLLNKKSMYILIISLFILKSVTCIEQKNWLPNSVNQSLFDEPFDYVNDFYLPDLVKDGVYDWIGSSGTTLLKSKRSYFAFSGTRKNSAKNNSSVYTKESGKVVLCESTISSSQEFYLNINCKLIEEKNLFNYEGIYFGAAIRSVQFSSDSAAFVYCDPLWFDINAPYKEPSGKCKLSFIKDFSISNSRDFQICSMKQCLGGYSVDIFTDSQNIDLIFGLPFSNSTLQLKQAQSNAISQATEEKGDFFNFGYAVSYAQDGSSYISSPVSDFIYNSSFVKIVNGENLYPQDRKTQNYGGFGTSMDTVKLGNNLYGAVIGAPYQSKQGVPNVGAVFLACKDHKTDVVFGDNKYDYFGYAVARIGDLDLDGSEEFAVSAPSLNLDKPGKIYIFKTSSDCKIQKKPIQIYQSNIKGFGVSISRGFDIDFNGSPDFFVTSLNSKKPALFKMPTQENVPCYWPKLEYTDIFSKGEEFKILISFRTDKVIDSNEYFFQVALDFMNKDEKRFELVEYKLHNNIFTLKVKLLMDAVDMDLKTVPLQVAIKGTRSCKKSNNEICFLSKSFNINWIGCENSIKLSQHICNTISCLSNLELKVRPDVKGTIIYLGNQKNYLRTLEAIILNKGPEDSPRIYMSINSNPDMTVTDVRCGSSCVLLSTSGPETKIIIKKTVGYYSELKFLVDVLYKQLNETKVKTSLNFKIWGINNDADLENNNFKVNYTVLFKPNLIFSSKKSQNTIIDDRKKPPYLEIKKRISVHELGTNLQYAYIIENKGPELKNVVFKLKFPHKTSDNKFILYIMDRILVSLSDKSVSALPIFTRNNKPVGVCTIPKDVVNPLQINAVERHNHENVQLEGESKRIKRSLQDDNSLTYLNFHNNSIDVESLSQNETLKIISSSDRSITIGCNTTTNKLGTPICSEVICTLAVIPTDSTFNFDFKAWVFTKTFFDARLADIIISTSIESNFGDIPLGVQIFDGKNTNGPVTVSQNILFSKMVVIPPKAMPLWPVILAVIIGIILLVIIIVIAYYCGFFKRKRLIREKKKMEREKKKLKEKPEEKYPLNS